MNAPQCFLSWNDLRNVRVWIYFLGIDPLDHEFCSSREINQSEDDRRLLFYSPDVLFGGHSSGATQFVLIDFSHKSHQYFLVLTPSNDPEEVLHTELLRRSDLISLSAQLSGKQPISGGEGRDTKRGMVGVCGTPSLCGIHCCPSVGHYFPPWGCRTLKPSGFILLHISEMLHITLFTARLQCGSHVCAGEYTTWTGVHLEVVLRISPQRWFPTCAGRRPVKVSFLEDKSRLRNTNGCLKLLQAASVR